MQDSGMSDLAETTGLSGAKQGSLTGSDRHMTAWTSVKMAVVPPISSASVRTAVIVKTRDPELTQRVAQFADEASQDVCSLTAPSVAGEA
jgi:hypothetical protein